MKILSMIAPVALCVLLLMSADSRAQSGQAAGEQPPNAQQLVREGDLAVKLVDALKVGTATNEAKQRVCSAMRALRPETAGLPITRLRLTLSES
jgi:hypothetical protein